MKTGGPAGTRLKLVIEPEDVVEAVEAQAPPRRQSRLDPGQVTSKLLCLLFKQMKASKFPFAP
jgi:hypothetical protein